MLPIITYAANVLSRWPLPVCVFHLLHHDSRHAPRLTEVLWVFPALSSDGTDNIVGFRRRQTVVHLLDDSDSGATYVLVW